MPYKLKNGIYVVRCRYPRCTFHSQFEVKQNIMGMTQKDVEIEAKRIARDMALIKHDAIHAARHSLRNPEIRKVSGSYELIGPAPRSGLCWWVNSDGIWSEVPRDAFAGAGAGNQLLLIVPSLDLIVVRNGAQIDRNSFWRGIEQHLLNPLMEVVEGSELE